MRDLCNCNSMQKTSPACFVFKLVTKTCFCSGLAILCWYKHSSGKMKREIGKQIKIQTHKYKYKLDIFFTTLFQCNADTNTHRKIPMQIYKPHKWQILQFAGFNFRWKIPMEICYRFLQILNCFKYLHFPCTLYHSQLQTF